MTLRHIRALTATASAATSIRRQMLITAKSATNAWRALIMSVLFVSRVPSRYHTQPFTHPAPLCVAALFLPGHVRCTEELLELPRARVYVQRQSISPPGAGSLGGSAPHPAHHEPGDRFLPNRAVPISAACDGCSVDVPGGPVAFSRVPHLHGDVHKAVGVREERCP